MLKGYRTYLATLCAGIAGILPLFTGVPVDIAGPAVALFSALAAYFRSQA